MTTIAGLGPHGERAASPDRLGMSEIDAAKARARRFSVAMVVHTTASDWTRQVVAGAMATLDRYGGILVEVAECGFVIDAQICALEALARRMPDAVISIPVAGMAVAEAHRGVSRAGGKLVLLDNAPVGLLAGMDYVSVISADNFGLGEIAAGLLSPHIRRGGRIGIVSYQMDFPATNEREIGFRKWMESARPDVGIEAIRFARVGLVAAALDGFLDSHSTIDGLFAVWDAPALEAMRALQARSRSLPMTTVDLGEAAAIALARGAVIKGIAAQRAYDQGAAAASAALSSLLGHDPPPWVVLPGVSVTAANAVEAYRTISHLPLPAGLHHARDGASDRQEDSRASVVS